jgi:hypothetical protein
VLVGREKHVTTIEDTGKVESGRGIFGKHRSNKAIHSKAGLKVDTVSTDAEGKKKLDVRRLHLGIYLA